MKSLILTVDVEPDDPQWKGLGKVIERNRDMTNIPYLKRLIPLMEKTGLAPTFLVTQSVACTDSFAIAFNEISKKGVVEIGMHTHPADTLPKCTFQSDVKDNLLTVNPKTLTEKLESHYDSLSLRFGKPKTFRGAAWTVNSPTLHWLASKNFRVDSSVTPGIDWRLRNRPDWSKAPRYPYCMDLNFPAQTNLESPLIEVPPTIWSPSHLPRVSNRLSWLRSLMTQPMNSTQSSIARWVKKIRPNPPRWLRPAFEDLNGMREIADQSSDGPCLHIMIHSNELGIGTSPYSKGEFEAERLFSRLSEVILFWIEKGWKPQTLSAFAKEWKSQNTLDTFQDVTA